MDDPVGERYTPHMEERRCQDCDVQMEKLDNTYDSYVCPECGKKEVSLMDVPLPPRKRRVDLEEEYWGDGAWGEKHRRRESRTIQLAFHEELAVTISAILTGYILYKLAWRHWHKK